MHAQICTPAADKGNQRHMDAQPRNADPDHRQPPTVAGSARSRFECGGTVRSKEPTSLHGMIILRAHPSAHMPPRCPWFVCMLWNGFPSRAARAACYQIGSELHFRNVNVPRRPTRFRGRRA